MGSIGKAILFWQLMNQCDEECLVVTKGSGVWGTHPEAKWSVFDGRQRIGYGSTLQEAYDAYHEQVD